MSGKTIYVCVFYGVFGWFVAANLLRLIGPVTFDLSWLHAFTLFLAAVVAFPTVWLGAKLTGTPMDQMTGPTLIFTASATFCDGLAITYAPQLYGGTGANLAYSAGIILFGVSWLMIVALYLSRSHIRET